MRVQHTTPRTHARTHARLHAVCPRLLACWPAARAPANAQQASETRPTGQCSASAPVHRVLGLHVDSTRCTPARALVTAHSDSECCE